MVKKITKLKICRQINQSCNHIMKNPMFWLKKFETLSKDKEELNESKKLLKKVKNDDKEQNYHSISEMAFGMLYEIIIIFL